MRSITIQDARIEYLLDCTSKYDIIQPSTLLDIIKARHEGWILISKALGYLHVKDTSHTMGEWSQNIKIDNF